MKKLKLMLILGMLLGGRIALAAEICQTVPDCASLGYTTEASKCEGGIVLYCPWDLTKAACEKCKIGSILGGNGLCYSSVPPAEVKPIGIVFDTTNRLAVALTDVKKDGTPGVETMAWDNRTWTGNIGNKYNIPNLQDCSNGNQCKNKVDFSTCGTNGQNNTKLILQNNSKVHEAAIACNKYEPVGCQKDFCKKTKWFLPSMRDLININRAKSQIVKASVMTDHFNNGIIWAEGYWSSTENQYSNAWVLFLDENQAFSCFANKPIGEHVRPVVKY